MTVIREARTTGSGFDMTQMCALKVTVYVVYNEHTLRKGD